MEGQAKLLQGSVHSIGGVVELFVASENDHREQTHGKAGNRELRQ
jgi:hypothetical protein